MAPGPLDWIPGELEGPAGRGLPPHPEGGEVPGPVVEVDGRRLVNLCSDDYLGLAGERRPERRAASGGLRRELERRLAALHRTEAALVFASRWHANAGAPAALVGCGDAVFGDELNHASLADGCRLSGAAVQRYRHGDADQLSRLLASTVARRTLVVTESVFGADGEAAPLPAIADLCRRHGAMLYLDESHATGVLGGRGAGLAEQAGCEGRADAVAGALDTALGGSGAFVAGSRALVDWLAASCRTFAHAPPPAACGAALDALDALSAEPERRGKLAGLATRMKDGLEWLGFSMERVVAPVFPVIVGGDASALQAWRALRERGYLVRALGTPAVPPGTSRLRVSLTAAHSREQVDGFLSALKEALEGAGWRPGLAPAGEGAQASAGAPPPTSSPATSAGVTAGLK